MNADPITLEVIRNGLTAAAEEMNANLIRAAYSPNIKERRDCSCALFGHEGTMVTQAENIPVHLGAMPFSVAAALETFSIDDLSDGDTLLLNDPFHGGAHLPDFTLITPIFTDDYLLGFAANRAHHADVGGTRAGSIAAESSEIYEEGVRIPPVRLYADGAVVSDVLSIILANTRDPEERRGDLRAQQAANETGRRRVIELVEKHGYDTLMESTRAVTAYSERRMRREIETIPNGTYGFEDVIEDDGRGNNELPICARIHVEDDSITIDFSGSADQTEGAVNAVRAVTVSAAYYAIRCLTDPDIPPNAGCYRPISVNAPAGSIVNAEPPAAVVGGNLETSQRIVDVIFGAFAETAPERTIAASQGTMNNVTFGGIDQDRGGEFAFYETQAGGLGARAGADGLDAVQIHMTNTMNTPIEVIESSYPLRVTRYELRPDTGGAGKYRGGLGLRRDIEVTNDDITCSLLSERRRTAPYGIAGGTAGAPGIDYLKTGKTFERVSAKSTHSLESGDIVSIRTPGGGGYGDPAKRNPTAIVSDILDGKLTEKVAHDQYDFDPEE